MERPSEPPPSVRQGHGRAHVGRSLPTGPFLDGDGRDRMFAVDDATLATGEAHAWCLSVVPRAEEEAPDDDASFSELRVTLAWTDPPAALPSAGPTLVNDLDLEIERVVVDVDVGRHAAGFDWARGGGGFGEGAPRDGRNNVEKVATRVRSPATYVVRVIGHAVRWTPADAPRGQPYAFVATAPGLRVVACPPGAGGGGAAAATATDSDPAARDAPAPRPPCRWWEYLDPQCW